MLLYVCNLSGSTSVVMQNFLESAKQTSVASLEVQLHALEANHRIRGTFSLNGADLGCNLQICVQDTGCKKIRKTKSIIKLVGY